MAYHEVVGKIRDLLSENGVWFETFKHKPVRTSKEAAEVRTGYSLKQGAKAIVLRVKNEGKKFFVMLVFPGDDRFDENKVKEFFNSRDVRFATEEEVRTITGGVEPGGIPPFGNLFGLRVVVDPGLFENEKIVFNAGDRAFSIAMFSADYEKLVNPEIVPIV
jgi:prolyl-tRNA editing enzyme YbaK/EbsC (Cys-tRNA(Pro) deacylase)